MCAHALCLWNETVQNVKSFYYEKILINCICFCFLLATKFSITICLIKHQVFLEPQMTIPTYKNILHKTKTTLKIWRKEIQYPQEEALLIYHFYHNEQMKTTSVNILNPIWHLIFKEKVITFPWSLKPW